MKRHLPAFKGIKQKYGKLDKAHKTIQNGIPKNNVVPVMSSVSVADRTIREKAKLKALATRRSLEIEDLDETVTEEVIVDSFCRVMGRSGFWMTCEHYSQFRGLKLRCAK